VYRLFLALRYLRSRLVNLVAVAGVAAGVAVLIVVTSVMDGFRVRVLQSIRGNLSDITMTPVVGPGIPLPDYDALDRAIRSTPGMDVIATSPVVEQVVFYLFKRGRMVGAEIQVGDWDVWQMRAWGIDWTREARVSEIARFLVAANDLERPFFSRRQAEREKEGTVLVSRTFAEQFLGLTPGTDPATLLEMDVGITFLNVEEQKGPNGGAEGQIKAQYATYQLPIAGVYDAEDSSFDTTRVFMERSVVARLARLDPYTRVRVKLQDPRRADAAKETLRRHFPDFVVHTWEDQRRQFLKAVNNEKVLLVIVLSFIVLLGGFIILATLTLTVVEKTRDIGVLTALGAHSHGVLSMFLGTGLLIGVLGSLFGLLGGWLFTDNVNAVKDFLENHFGVQIFPPDIYLFDQIPTVWHWPTVVWIMGGSVLISFLAGLVPALRASRMDPVKALRYE
jgi:lipoprotein-releasing system permease protein